VKWVEVVEVEAEDAAAALGAAADVDLVAWAAPRPPGREATVFAPVVDIKHRTLPVSLATRRSARSVAHR